MLRSLLLVLLGVLSTAPAAADHLELTNGDRFTGSAVSLAGGTLVFATPYGDIRLPWADVARLVVDEPILATIEGRPPSSVTIAQAAAAGQVTLQPGGDVALSAITALTRPQPPLVLDGGASAGIVDTGGNTDVKNLRLDGDLLARAGEHRYTVNAAVTRARDRGLETARNWTAGVKYDRFLSPRLFLNANTILTSDRFSDLDLRTALGAGIGYQVLNIARVTLTADAGLGYVNENLESQAGDSYAAARESATLSVFIVPDLVEIFHQHDGYIGVTGDDNLFVRLQNGIRIGLGQGFVTTLRHDLDYDRSPAIGRRSTDRTFALTLGYRF